MNTSARHLRRLCGHCNEELSYSAYRSHKALYYLESEGRWLSQTDKDDDQCSGIHQADAGRIIEDTQMDQTGKNLLIFITYPVPSYQSHNFFFGIL